MVQLCYIISINYNMDVQYQRCTYDNGAPILFFKECGLVYRCKYSHMTTQIFDIDGLSTFLRYSMELRSHAFSVNDNVTNAPGPSRSKGG